MLITSEMILDAKELHEYIWDYVYKQAEFDLYNTDEYNGEFPIGDWKYEAIHRWERDNGTEVKLIGNCVLCQISNRFNVDLGECRCKFCEKMGFLNVGDVKSDVYCLNGLWEQCFEPTEEGLEAIGKIRDLFKERGI